MNDQIIIRGARTHNLKNIDCAIPHGQLTVVTGVSGSGKSSLAFDTVYAEGQRRYVESLSAYARQFLERMEKPDVDFIDGLAPAVAIKQKNTTRNPRSTVATATEIYDYLRLLYARCGTVHCIVCNGIVRRDSVDEIAAAILALGEGTRLYALFPVTSADTAPNSTESEPEKTSIKRPRKTAAKKSASKKTATRTAKKTAPAAQSPLSDALKDRLGELRKRGFNRLYQNGRLYEFSTPESLLEIDFEQPLFILVDRLVVSADNRARIVDAAEIAYREAGEILYQVVPRNPDPDATKTETADPDATAPQQPGLSEPPAAVSRTAIRFSAAFECKTCHRVYRDPEPRLFSFNNPYGACPRCQGFGNTIDFDQSLIIPDPSKTLSQGAIDPFNRPKYRAWNTELRRAAIQNGIPITKPWFDLTDDEKSFVLDGRGTFPGVHGFFEQMERKKYKLHVRVMLSKYRGYALCPECKGQRLRAEARAVLIHGKNICEAAALTIRQANDFFQALELSPMQAEIAGSILEEVRRRIHFLDAVGLDYLTLDRLASTLSGGEAQRIQLATSLGSQLVGALYVLDEPSIGLHTRDTAKLIHILEGLRDLGNTIVVVEHDPDIIRAADHILDLGPGAGEFGGQLLAAGTVAEIEQNPASITGKYLSSRLTIPVPKFRREVDLDNKRTNIRLEGARANNLRGVDVEIPLNVLTCVTGVSGSGKSTLVHQVLYKVISHQLGRVEGGDPSHLYRAIHGADRLNDVVLVDQNPIGRTPRSNPVTYIKAFDAIRELFSSQPEARRRGYSPGYFSFNVPGGRCDVCDGDGTVTVEMQFLADVELPCEECNATRYKPSTLEIKYKGKSIHDVLGLTVKEALRFFTGHPKITDKLAVLDEIGLGYLRLGQSATTLSGGEAQRVKLALHLASVRSTGHTAARKAANRILYILDEPTTGLHFEDNGKLLMAFKKLIDGGASLLVIEHNLDIIKSADWIIDLGPEGGSGGGHIVATGTPEEIVRNPLSHTGQWLARVLPPDAAERPSSQQEVVV